MKRRLCGTHAVQEALRADPARLAVIWVVDDSARSPHRALIEAARRAGVAVETHAAEMLDACAAGLRHQGVLAISGVDYPYVDLDAALGRCGTPPLLVLLDEITDVHNFGAIVRSAVALGADAVVTLRDRAAPVSAAVVRASAGATEHATIARVTNLARTIETLVEREYCCVGLAADAAISIRDVPMTGPVALVVGSEGSGLRRLVRERCSMLASIPMTSALGSLNASVATAIALYEVRRQRGVRA